MKRIAFLSLITMGCIATVSAVAGGPDHANTPSVFDGINAHGHLNITIVPLKNDAKPYYTIKHNHGVEAQIHHHTLYLSQSSSKTSDVVVHMNQLNNLRFYGQGTITANHIYSYGLNLSANAIGRIKLNGMINANKIAVSGPTQVSIKWLQGNNISLYAGRHAHLFLAGEIGTMRAQLSGHSFMNARYLRSQHLWLVTRGFAQAQVLPLASLQAYPQDKSNIYYYKTPQLLNSTNQLAGNTLQLGWDN